jgi:hypothetical protein
MGCGTSVDQNGMIQNKWLWIGCENGSILQFDIPSMKLHKDHGKIHKKEILMIQHTPDGKYLLTSDKSGFLVHFSNPQNPVSMGDAEIQLCRKLPLIFRVWDKKHRRIAR